MPHNPSFSIKEGDTAPPMKVILRDENRDPRDLQNVTEIRFQMRHVSSQEVVVNDTATIIVEKDGSVVYNWSKGDTDKVGRHSAEFEVTFDNSGTETFPNSGNIDVYVEKEVA